MTADNIPYQFLLCALAALRGDSDSGNDVTADGGNDDGDGDGYCHSDGDGDNDDDNDDGDSDGYSDNNVTLSGPLPTSPRCALLRPAGT